jgi:hypothetical protein
MNSGGWFFYLLVAGVSFLAYIIFVIGPEQSAKYRAACIEVGGKPMHNGKHWECLK